MILFGVVVLSDDDAVLARVLPLLVLIIYSAVPTGLALLGAF